MLLDVDESESVVRERVGFQLPIRNTPTPSFPLEPPQ